MNGELLNASDRCEMYVTIAEPSEKDTDNTYNILASCIPAAITAVTAILVVFLTSHGNKQTEIRLKYYDRRLDALEKINNAANDFFGSIDKIYYKKKKGKEYIDEVHQYYSTLNNRINSAAIYLTKDEKALLQDCQIRISLIQYTNWDKEVPERQHQDSLLIRLFLEDTLRIIALDKQPRWMKKKNQKKRSKKKSKC